MRGRDDIIGMVHGVGHQGLLGGECGHVLNQPTGSVLRWWSGGGGRWCL
jgi:hypothetical protein